MELPDGALVEQIRNGDGRRWRELYQRHESAVFRFALRRLRDVDEAEDVRQDVFLQAMRGLDCFEGRSSLETWLLGITRHEVSRRFRASRRRTGWEASRLEHRACEVVLEDRVDARRALERCARLVARAAPPGQRRVFHAHVRGGLGAEVAREVGRSREAVRTSLCRTRHWLFSRLPGLADLLTSRCDAARADPYAKAIRRRDSAFADSRRRLAAGRRVRPLRSESAK